MGAMKDLHQEYGEVVYRFEIERSITRDGLVAKEYELRARYGNSPEFRGILNDIYDDVTDFPQEWAHYGSNVPAGHTPKAYSVVIL